MKKVLLAVAAAIGLADLLQADPYLEATGAQAVNTGYYACKNTKVVADWAYTSASPTQQRIFGNELPSGDNRYLMVCSSYINGSGGYSWAMKDYVGNWTSLGVTVTTDRRQITIDGMNNTVTFTGGGANVTQTYTHTPANRANTPMVLCARPSNFAGTTFADYSKVKFYSLQIYENNVLLHDYRPRKCNGVGVVYDTVTGHVLASGTATPFIASDDCETVAGPITTDVMTAGGNYIPAVPSEGLLVENANYAGNFIPQGDRVNGMSGSVTLRGANSFGGALTLYDLPKTYSPRIYTGATWSKDFFGKTDNTKQVVYELTAESGAGVSFGGGCEDRTDGQRGDVVRFTGNFTFGGNVTPNGNDGVLWFKSGAAEVGSIKMQGSRGYNSFIVTDADATLHCRGDVFEGSSKTGGNPFFLDVRGVMTIDGVLGMANSNGDVFGGGTLNVHEFIANKMKSPIPLPEVNIGTGGARFTGTRFKGTSDGCTIGCYDGNTFIAGSYSFEGANGTTTLRASMTDGVPTDITLNGTPTCAGQIVKTGDGALVLAPVDASKMTGDFDVREGSLIVDVPMAIPGDVTVAVGAAFGVSARGYAMLAGIALEDGAVLQIEAAPSGFGCIELAPNSIAAAGHITLRIVTAAPPAVGMVGTLLTGANLNSADLAGISVEIVDLNGSEFAPMDGDLSVVGGNVVFTVTESLREPAGDLTWNGGASTAWDFFSPNWLKAGVASEFFPFDNAIFGAVGGTVTIDADGVDAGDVTFNGAQTYSLTGDGQLRGAGTITVDNAEANVNWGVKIDAQPIVVRNGILKPTATNRDLFGSPNVPITVLDGGTFDVNKRENTVEEILMTHNKKFRIAGSGVRDSNGEGMGALANTGTSSDTSARIHTIELTDDALVKISGGRIDMRARSDGANTGRPQITGTNYTFTLGGGSFCLTDVDFKVKKAVITGGAVLSIEGGTKEEIPDGIHIDRGILQLWARSNQLTQPIVADGTSPRISTGAGTTTITHPITVTEGTTLNLQGSNLAATKYAGGITGPGNVKVGGDVQHFTGDLSQETLLVTRGFAVYGDGTAAGNEKKWPKTVTLSSGTVNDTDAAYLCLSPSTNSTFSGYTISGTGSFVPSRQKVASSVPVSTIENTTLSGNVGIAMGFATNNSAYLMRACGEAVLGNGFRADSLNGISLGLYGSAPADATLTLAAGSDVTLKSGSRLVLGMWSGVTNNVHRVVVDGGTLDAAAATTQVGYDGRVAEFLVKSGTAKFGAVGLRTRNSNNMTPIKTDLKSPVSGVCYEVFGMSGGVVELGGNFITERFYSYLPQIWLGGGTLKSITDWSTDNYQAATFETFGDSRDTTKKTFTLDTNGKTATFRSALQGNANVRITGSGNFVADNNVQGGLSGHWTIENTGTANLKNAAAFAEGLTLADGTSATIDIGARTNYTSIAAGSLGANTFNANEFTADNFHSRAGVFPNLFSKNMQHLITRTSTPTYTAYRQEAEFFVPEADTYTFAVSYDDRGDIYVDGTRVAYNSSWNVMGRGEIALSAGWHRINLTCMDLGGGAGPTSNTEKSPDPNKWRLKGMAAGWHKGATTSTDPALYQPINSKTLKMRPVSSVRWNRRYANAVVQADWKTNDTYTFSMVTNSMRALHDSTWTPNAGSVISYTGWTYVEPEDAGVWNFDGVYDDHINVQFDGKTVFENTTWSAAKSSTAQVSAGWHKFKVSVTDGSGGYSWSGVKDYGAALYVKRPTDAVNVSFDERNIRMTSDPYGFIGGELNVGAGATLTNVSDTPCEITGTVTGSGTISGKFELTGEWNLEMDDGQHLKCVKWEGDGVDLSRGRLNIALTKKRALKAKYDLGIVTGLNGIQSRINTTLDGVPYDNAFTIEIENGNAVLKNLKPANTVIYLR